MKPGKKNSYNSLSDIKIDGENYKFYSLKKAEENKFKILKTEQWQYYTGNADPQVYINKPFDHKVLRQDVDKYMDADEDLIKQLSKIDYYQVMISYLDSILKTIGNRTYQVKNAIEWQQFIRGYSD